LPSLGFEGARISLKSLPLPKDLKKSFEHRLIDIRNTVLVDLKISNAEKIITSSTPSTSAASQDGAHTDVEDNNHLRNGHVTTIKKTETVP
jgi:hypothetical protein